jgi:2-polyprenyl-3-methyl-5-hydroxy-6-metoxy-1,4-benzoquinol methylase
MREPLESLVRTINLSGTLLVRLKGNLRKFSNSVKENKMRNQLLNVQCGLCSDKGKWIKLFDYPSADVPQAEIFQCGTCGVIRNASATEIETSNEIIQSQWVTDGFYKLPAQEKDFEEEASHAAGIFPWLENQLGLSLKNLTMLEIGAGSGLRSAGATKFFREVYSSDSSLDLLNNLKEYQLGKKVTVLGENDLWNHNIDWIIGWHVFEHLKVPSEYFKNGHEVLSSSGGFFFQVPLLSPKNVFPGHHYFFTQTSLDQFFASLGNYETQYFFDTNVEALTCIAVKLS